MKKKLLFSNDVILYLASFFIVVFIFNTIYGLKTLNPTNINWIMAVYHDWGQHYLGWSFYRNEPWGFPLGNMDSFYYPVGTNVGFTDSAPLFAFVFKIVGGILPENFQYLGMLLFLCHLLVAYYTIKICKLFNVNNWLILLSVILLASNPVLVFRGIHPALSTHFLILASLYNYLKTSTTATANRINYNQVLLFFLAVTINPYIAMMIVGFNIILPLKHYFFEKSITVKQLLYFPILSIASGLFFWIVFGMINISSSTSTNLASVDNFRQYSFNLNSFFNSYGYFSKFLPNLGMVNDKQYEGFAYFGFGMLLLIAFMIAYCLLLKLKGNTNVFHVGKKYFPLFFLCIGLFIFSLSCQLTFGTKVLFEYPIPDLIEKIGFTFRASGRFVWPLFYLLLIGFLLLFFRTKINDKLKIGILLVITAIQIYDIQDLLTKYDFKSGDYHTKLSDEKIIPIFKQFDEIITYPCFNNNLLYTLDYQDFCFLALKAKKPITNGYVARDNAEKTQIFRDSLINRLNRGEIKNELFVTTESNLEDFTVLLKSNKVTAKPLDGFIYIYSKQKNLDHYFNADQKEEQSLQQQIDNLGSQDDYVVDTYKPVESNAIQYNFDNYGFANSVLRINGWACLKSANDATGDNVFMVISNEKSTLRVPVTVVKRPDVTAAQGRGNLDDSGFKVIVFTTILDKGDYDLGILIEDKNGVKSYTKTDRKLHLTNEKELVKTKPKGVENFVSKIDAIDLTSFTPIKSKDNSGLVFFENSATKSPKLYVKKGNYKIVVEGISYPEKPLKGINAHFNVKIKGKKIGEFHLNENTKKPNPTVLFSVEENQQIQLELVYDNDEIVDKIDRNARITKIAILPN